jgi:fructokinase
VPARPTIVGIGEILWDMFPEGPQFGGAPANFACSVAELSGGDCDVYIVSAVGRDDLGRRALQILQGHRVNTKYVSLVEHATGQVLVHLDSSGQASYEFAANTAWDNLAWTDELQQLAARADAICFGTLGQRSDISRATIQRFLTSARPDCLRILDINLRPPFWSKEVVLQSLELANMLKLNDSELELLANILSWKSNDEALLKRFLKDFSLQLVALTRGAGGALIVTSSGHQSDHPGERVAVNNTVGAGDAFTAALTIGMLKSIPLAKTNAWANRIAAFVCTQPGAAPTFPPSFREF